LATVSGAWLGNRSTVMSPWLVLRIACMRRSLHARAHAGRLAGFALAWLGTE
jgi:hypothetical protein